MIRSVVLLLLLASAGAASAEPLHQFNGRLFIEAELNGVRSEALLDSGAEATLVDPALAARAGLPEGMPQVIRGSAGESRARIVEGATVRALGVELHPEVVVVTDLGDLSRRLIRRPTELIVGRELFDAARLRIAIAQGSIEVVDRTLAPAGTRLALTPHAGIESIPVTVSGRPAQAEFDLGNGSDVLISRALARKLQLKTVGRKRGGGIGGAIERDLVTLPELEVGGVRFRDQPAAVDDQPNANDLNIGTAVLRHFLITADFKERAVWLLPLGGIDG